MLTTTNLVVRGLGRAFLCLSICRGGKGVSEDEFCVIGVLGNNDGGFLSNTLDCDQGARHLGTSSALS